MTLAQLLIFIPAAFLVAMSPGANNLLAFSNGSRAGFGAAIRALAGRLVAFALMIGLVAAGLGAVLATSKLAFTLIKWAGAAYLLWLAVRMWSAPVEQGAPPPVRMMRAEFLTAMSNPKAVLLFTAFLPQFVVGDTGISGQLMALGVVYIAVEGAAAALWAGGGAWLGARALSAARRKIIDRAAALAMIGAAGLILRSERP
ncbi:LysE family translocator [Pontivivens ytuae]|uniref:LysE family translocator n=1 Tax=Pontivivens ytuae TaxID=2789856 RepID=A0A7S9LU24_9RHOB|nr:LysE family translocator [Pontivivens ytuae]QPH55129.1 LysE family translocator [Pontivivens ytuae]